ncbi:MAG: WD40 repeat domain-containing protein [Xanthomonadales bacterium]|nr:WD40 repeat domain-containing protein [Xanthomonadales bacterium]
MGRMMTGALLALVLLSWESSRAELAHVNWENHPVNGLDISPDGRLLAVAHTADHRVQLFDISEGRAVPAGHVRVGLDPVSVRFRSSSELWVVNHISDSVSIVDLDQMAISRTLQTGDEPADVVFAGGRAFVSCSQENHVLVYQLGNLDAAPARVDIDAEDPRSLAVSPDGSQVLAAVFESGNATTILGGGGDADDTIAYPPNVTRQINTPYGGQNPPPNSGTAFEPPMTPGLPRPPEVGLIVRKDGQGRWRDDNGEDWTSLVSGSAASQSGRVQGWDLPDRDIAVIDVADLSVSYASGLMNIGMGLGINPATGEATLVGTDASNEIRFEPVLNGRFVQVKLARVKLGSPNDKSIVDLNPHLDYQAATVSQSGRDLSLGDPRSIVWQSDGQRGFVAGLGSNNVIVINSDGGRAAGNIEVGEGPVALGLDETHRRLYVWNHFDLSLSTVSLDSLEEIERTPVFNPLPQTIRDGRKFLYGTHETSGLGQVSCAACHVDGRMDRLAWDLGDPSGEVKAFNQNCVSDILDNVCTDFHPMKGPMMTQTFQDIIGHEPFHWRGDRTGLEEFNGAFTHLLGDDVELTVQEMQAFEDFVATITFPPNPFRNLDNSLPEAVDLTGHFTTGRFAPAGQPLGTGNAVRGLELYTRGLLDEPFHCSNCHTLPTGMATNGALFLGNIGATAGGSVLPHGLMGENHLGVVSVDGSTQKAIKVPHLRNMYEKVGFEATQQSNRAGFGFLHDGSVDSLARFITEPAFELDNDQQVADLVALMLAFSGSDFGPDPTLLDGERPLSKDSHAAVGAQASSGGSSEKLNQMVALASAGVVDLTASGGNDSWRYSNGQFQASGGGEPVSLQQLLAGEFEVTFTVVPAGLGQRLGNDRDGDGVGDRLELKQGSNPADPDSNTLTPTPGLWFNPSRSGHGFDLQRQGDFLFITWYTYNDDGSPTWYQAAAPFGPPEFSADLNRFRWNPDTGFVDIETVGTATLSFSDASHAVFSWQIGDRPGSEPFELLVASDDITLRNYTGTWYDPDEPGWGLTLYTQGNVRVGVMYFYDSDNEPRWVLGQSDNSVSGGMDMLSFSGFCPDCDLVQTGSADGGSVDLNFSSLRNAALESAVSYPGVANSSWLRTVDIEALSDAYLDPKVY